MSPVDRICAIKPTDLPTPPRAAIEVIKACSRPEITNKDLAEVVSRDPVLTAEVLRITNSAYFGLHKQVSSVSHAVGVLGHRALRNLVLCTAIRDALGPHDIPGVEVAGFWTESLRRAVCARYLAEIASYDREECFTIGLLQDFGRMAMFKLSPERAIHWRSLACADPDHRLVRERELFGVTHEAFGESLMAAWDFPEDICAVVGAHHDDSARPANGANQGLSAIAQCADWMTAVFATNSPASALERCHELLAEHFGVEAERSADLLGRSTEGVVQAAAALGLEVHRPLNFDDVMREANLRLAEETLSYQQLTWRLERALEERDRFADELKRELVLAREVQQSLLPKESRQLPGVLGVNFPAKELSGDFYDYYRLSDGRICFCLADVSGKGMNAALLMAKTSSLFHCLGKALHDPSKLLAMLNREIIETSVRGMFVTLVAGVLDPRTGEVCLANAGHLPVLIMEPDGSAIQLPCEAPPLGVLPDAAYPCRKFSLGQNALYLFTDGLIDAKGGSGERLQIQGLIDLIRSYRSIPLKQRLQQLMEGFGSIAKGMDDDWTLLVIENA